MSKAFVIRDPVHGYIRVAAHERIVVDHPVTQRLRRVTQTGLAELVFPEARTSRFVHSLGAMHLTSRFVIAALENASEADAAAFFEELSEKVNYGISPNQAQLMQLMETNEAKSTGGLMSGRKSLTNKAIRGVAKNEALLALAEAATRLAALFHDLGHMPYSHDFEYALKSYAKGGQGGGTPARLKKLTSGTPHEILGHRLADLVFQGLANSTDTPGGAGVPGVIAAFKLAKDILDDEPDYELPQPQIGALGWLHSLVDGQVDVDRADYLLRDARALGFEFAGYNLDQLIDNLVLVRDSELGFVTAIDEKGLIGLESFCSARSRSNQVLVRHHKSAQIGAAFRLASIDVLSTPSADSFLSELGNILDASGDGEKARELLKAFSRHDDPWWLELLRNAAPPGTPLGDAARSLILDRAPNSLRSIWKRKGDLTEKERKAINDLVAIGAEDLEAFEKATHTLREKHNILIAIHRFKPFTKTAEGHSVLLVRTRGGHRPASAISPLIASLERAWQEDIHMHAFSLSTNPITPSQLIDDLKKALANAKRLRKVKKIKVKEAKPEPSTPHLRKATLKNETGMIKGRKKGRHT